MLRRGRGALKPDGPFWLLRHITGMATKRLFVMDNKRSDQSFNERMREGNEGYRVDFRPGEDSQVRLPLMESI